MYLGTSSQTCELQNVTANTSISMNIIYIFSQNKHAHEHVPPHWLALYHLLEVCSVWLKAKDIVPTRQLIVKSYMLSMASVICDTLCKWDLHILARGDCPGHGQCNWNAQRKMYIINKMHWMLLHPEQKTLQKYHHLKANYKTTMFLYYCDPRFFFVWY